MARTLRGWWRFRESSWQGVARSDQALRGQVWQGLLIGGCSANRQGFAWQGVARQGGVWHGTARTLSRVGGVTRILKLNSARPGVVWRGLAWHGTARVILFWARQGSVRQH